jgi:hypothetical protein
LPLIPFPVEDFGGLDVINDPPAVGVNGATDLLNVTFDRPGRIRARDGTSVVSTSAAAATIAGLAYYKTAGGTEYIVAGANGGSIYPFDLSTGIVGTVGGLPITGGNNSFARFGDTSNTRLYIAGGGLTRFDGAYTNVVVPVTATYAAVTANDNRLVIATSGLDGKVHFSGAGAPETWGASDFVTLWPGDGEPITGLARWQDKLFAFKSTKFAVFTGTGLQSDGSPIFTYYSVDSGQGANNGAVVAGDQGLYFANNSGVYVTTGGPAAYLSRPLEPWIAAGTSGSLPTLSMANLTLAYFANKLYVTDRTNRTTLVYDTVQQKWSVWQIGATAIARVPSSSTRSGIYFGENASSKVWKLDSSVTTDNGTAIPWSYTTGYSSAGGYFRQRIISSGERKKHFRTDILGSGTVTHQVLALNGRPNDVADPGASVTLGTAPTLARGSRRRGVRGSHFAHKLSSSVPAVVSGLTYWLSEVSMDT